MTEDACRLEDVCVFCRIVRGEIPASTVYEDDQVLAFLDIAPLSPGHTLVIPKAHHVSLTTVPAVLIGQLFAVAGRIAPAVMRAVDGDGFNLLLSNGSCAGQVVPHVHLHLIPRSADDGLVLPHRTRPYATDADRQAVQDAIRQRLAAAAAVPPTP